MQNYIIERNYDEHTHFNTQPLKVRLKIVERNNREASSPQAQAEHGRKNRNDKRVRIEPYDYLYDQIAVEECEKAGVSPYEARKVARGIERNITRARQLGLRLFRESFKSLGITACDQPAAPAASAKVKITDVSKGDEAEAKGRSFKDYVYKHDIISPRACEAAGVSQKEVRKVARGMERYVRRARELGVAAFSPCEAGLRVVLSPAPTEPVECKEAGIPAAQAAEAEIVDRSAIRPKPVRRKRVSHARAKDAPRAKPRMPGRLKKGETEKAGKIPWSLTFCPYADGSMKIEGDRMPDPAWGF